jgi:hypothetical protein
MSQSDQLATCSCLAIFAVPEPIRMPFITFGRKYDFALVLPVHPHENMAWYQPIRAMMLLPACLPVSTSSAPL